MVMLAKHDPERSRPKFSLGQIVATQNAANVIPADEIARALHRHVTGDWGDLDSEDWQANERAVNERTRLFSQYYSAAKIKFWIITEWDRSVTTVLLPEDY